VLQSFPLIPREERDLCLKSFIATEAQRTQR
jgi:hypothetical protein